ncbi:MAG: hypothetical protein ABR615_09620 [Pseudonocardiaceae bacterium]
MSDAMSLAELTEYHVELLPPRTVLSLLRADGTPGEPGTPGANGPSESQSQNASDKTAWPLVRDALSGAATSSGTTS